MEQIEELLENSLVRNLAIGISIALAIMCLLLSITTFVLGLIASALYLLAVPPCVICVGAAVGLVLWLFEEYG